MMTKNLKMKIGITVAILLIVLIVGILIAVFSVPKSLHSISLRAGDFKSTQQADLHIGLTKK